MVWSAASDAVVRAPARDTRPRPRPLGSWFTPGRVLCNWEGPRHREVRRSTVGAAVAQHSWARCSRGVGGWAAACARHDGRQLGAVASWARCGRGRQLTRARAHDPVRAARVPLNANAAPGWRRRHVACAYVGQLYKFTNI